MFKTNNIKSLLFPQNTNTKYTIITKSNEKILHNKEKENKTFRNKYNLIIKTITQSQIKKPLFQKYNKSKINNNKNSKSKHKSHHKCLTASNSILYNEIFNNPNSHSSLKNLNSKQKINNNYESNKDEIINSYEKGVLFLFDILKGILDKNKYDEIKNKFINEFNCKLNKKENKISQSTLQNSNSLKKILDDCIHIRLSKNNYIQKKLKNYKNYSLLRQSHKSLYSLSRINNKVLSQSPNKINENEMTFVNHYFTEKNNPINSKSINNGNIYFNNKKLNSKNLNNIHFNKNKIKNIIKNQINKKQNINDSSCDLLSKIKDSLDDDLKKMFNFSYEYFLNQESERYEKK